MNRICDTLLGKPSLIGQLETMMKVGNLLRTEDVLVLDVFSGNTVQGTYRDRLDGNRRDTVKQLCMMKYREPRLAVSSNNIPLDKSYSTP